MLSQFPAPMCFVKEEDGPSTEKPRQFMCHYHCRYMQSYFCFSSDHVDMLATLMSYRVELKLDRIEDVWERDGTFDHLCGILSV